MDIENRNFAALLENARGIVKDAGITVERGMAGEGHSIDFKENILEIDPKPGQPPSLHIKNLSSSEPLTNNSVIGKLSKLLGVDRNTMEKDTPITGISGHFNFTGGEQG